MGTQHTPGPWNISGVRDGGGLWLHIGAAGSPMVLASMNEVHADTEANARLIAAAPELLEALTDPDLSEAIYAWSNEKNIGSEEYDRRSVKVEKMHAAIARATGAA